MKWARLQFWWSDMKEVRKTLLKKEAKGELLNHLCRVKCLNVWQSDCKWDPWALMSCGVTSSLSNTRLHRCLAICWLQGRQMLNSKQQLPPWRMVCCKFLCLKECRRKWSQLVFRLLNSTVWICPEGEVDCFHFLTFFASSWYSADSHGDLNALIPALITAG